MGGVSPRPASVPDIRQAEDRVRKTISTTVRLACTAAPSRFVTMISHDQAFVPVVRATATAAGPTQIPGMC